ARFRSSLRFFVVITTDARRPLRTMLSSCSANTCGRGRYSHPKVQRLRQQSTRMIGVDEYVLENTRGVNVDQSETRLSFRQLGQYERAEACCENLQGQR